MNLEMLKAKFKSKKNDEKSHKKSRMFILRKKQIMAVCLMILIGVAGYLNWSFSNDAVDPDVAVMYNEAAKKIGEAQMVNATQNVANEKNEEKEPEINKGAGNDYFAQAKLEREVKRSESTDILTQLISNKETDRDVKENAQKQIQRMAEYTEKEVNAENIIRSKGFGQTIVFISEDAVSVALETDGLNEIDAAQIQDVIVQTTGYKPSQIKIVEIRAGR